MGSMKQVLAGIVIASAVAGCGGKTPTAPSDPPVVSPTVANAPVGTAIAPGVTPDEPKAPDPKPEPTPDPKPDPKPGPAPAPTPNPNPQPPTDVRQALTTSAHWYSDAAGLPAAFNVATSAGVITFGPCPATAVLIETPTSQFARPCGANVQIVEETWTYSGVLGLAAGTIR